jgi:hypothetical protein
MKKYDPSEEIIKAIQKTPLISMRPVMCEWKELIENCDLLSYVRSCKKELQHKISQHIQQINHDAHDKDSDEYKNIAEDLSACMKEADVSYL